METIGRLAKQFGLARSTLLYYDKIGILKPSGYTSSGYRVYAASDADRLARIRLFRDAGLSLSVIKQVLDGSESVLRTALEDRLKLLNSEMNSLRQQQDLVCRLLRRALPKTQQGLSKEIWTNLLAASGFSDKDMHQWHVAFERHAPERHQAFLETLNIPDDEIRDIRSFADHC